MNVYESVSRDTLDDFVEFDLPFKINDGAEFVFGSTRHYAPCVTFIDGDIDIDGKGWEAVSGFSGQYGYSGPVMHPSEFLGGGMAQHVLDNPGLYCITEVLDMDDPEAIVGWILLVME